MSEYITVRRMAEFREQKVGTQKVLHLRHPNTITVTLGMNIPGPKKTDCLIVSAFREGCRVLMDCLAAADLTAAEKIILEEPAGNVGIFSVDGGKADLEIVVKQMAVDLEERHPLGRLFDIDVYDMDGNAVSRQKLGLEERRCLICGGDARVCGRSRNHCVEELQQRVYEIIGSWAYGSWRE